MQENDVAYREVESRLAERLKASGVDPCSDGTLPPLNANRNLRVAFLARALLEAVGNVKAFVQSGEIVRRFDLLDRFGLDPSPLWNLNPPDRRLPKLLRDVYSTDHFKLERCFDSMSRHLGFIQENRLLGAETISKMAFVRQATGLRLRDLSKLRFDSSANEDPGRRLAMLRSETIDLLTRQAYRLGPSHGKACDVDAMVRQIREAVPLLDVFYFELNDLGLRDPRRALGSEAFCETFRDEVIQLLGQASLLDGEDAKLMAPEWRYLRRKGVEVAYVPRTSAMLTIGDRYGDCTASRPNKQLDDVENISWTTYSWLLDPFYRILEVHVDGDPIIKAHLLPLVFKDRPALTIDAIEVVPKLRDVVRSKPHAFLSQRLFQRRTELLEILFASALEIADRMGAEWVYVDRYSNAEWVREAIGKLPAEAYRLSDVHKPFGLEPLSELSERWLGSPLEDAEMEVQATNPWLMDHGLAAGYREIARLAGRRVADRLPIRGP